MAGNYQEYTTKIFLNDEQAQNKIENLRKSIEKYRQDKEKALNTGGKEGDKAWKEANRNIKAAEAELKKLSTTSQSINRVLNNLDTASVKDLKNTIKIINKELASGSVERNSAEWQALNAQLRRAKTELAGIQAESAAASGKGFIAQAADSLNRNWGAITQFIGGVTMLTLSIRRATQAFADMEEEMADVRKYTGQTTEEVHAMNEEFKGIDTRTSREQLNRLAGAAGRLGITAHDGIMDFVDAADKIDVALGEDLGEDAVQNIGKLAMAFGEDDRIGLRGAMLASGSAVNELSQNSSASAQYLVDFTARLAGVGQVAGMTQAQIMALGSVMDENMQRDEMASTALSNLITKLATDSSKFAKIAGINVKEFADLVEHDMNGALLKFAKTLQGKGGLMKLAPMFNEMGLDGSRAVGVLTVLANKVDDVKKNQLLANKAYAEANSIIKEFNVQNTTVQAGIDKNIKRFNDLTVELGEKLLPIVKYTVSGGSLLIKSLSALIDFTTIYRTTLIAVTATLVILNAKKLYHIALTKLEVIWTNNLKKTMLSAWAVMRKNPYAVVATAVVTLGAAMYDLMRTEDKHVQSLKEEQEEAKEFQKNVSESAAKSQAQYNRLQKEYQKLRSVHEKREWIQKSKESFDSLGISVGNVNTAENIFVKNTKIMMDAFKKRAEAAAWHNKAEELYIKRNERQAEIDKKKAKIYAGAKLPKGTIGYENVEAIVGRDGYLHYTDEGAKRAHAALDNDNILKQIDDEIDNITNHAIQADGEVNRLLKDAGADTVTGSTQFVSEKAAKNKQLEATRRKRDADKRERAELNDSMAALAMTYGKGLITYSEFLDKQRALQLASLKKRKAIWGEESNDAKQLADDELRIQRDYANKMLRQKDADIERERIVTAAKLQTMFYDRNERIYMNEDALNEALFENDMRAIEKMMSVRNAGSEQWIQLKSRKEQAEAERKYAKEVENEQLLLHMREQYGEKSAEQQMQIALNGLELLYKKELVMKEEYDKMLLHISGQYADRGPGYNAAKFSEDVESALNLARHKAGDESNPENDNVIDALFGNDIKNWKNVNEQIKKLLDEGVITHAQANAAKAQNDAEYLDTLLSRTQYMYNIINNVVSAAADYSKACSDLEVARIEKNYEKQIQAAGKNSKKKEKLEKKRDEDIRRARTAANAKAVKIQIAQAIATSAMSALEAYASVIKALPYPANMTVAPIAAGLALAAGAIQIATIKKQAAAQQAGYYEGGFTSGKNYRRAAGIVHQGEFVANHHAVNNPAILPALQLIDMAQRNNTVASLTGADVSRAVGGGATVVAPIINVENPEQAAQLGYTAEQLAQAVSIMNDILGHGIKAYVTIDGDDGIKKNLDRFNKLNSNV